MAVRDSGFGFSRVSGDGAGGVPARAHIATRREAARKEASREGVKPSLRLRREVGKGARAQASGAREEEEFEMVTLVEEPVDVAAVFRGGKPVLPPGRCRRNAASLGGTSGGGRSRLGEGGRGIRDGFRNV
ncbi:MAG: hypothetical protein HPY75_05885 [Actinobacteria bacterium]|nr:hypothetical protein [Actinomycetota bacterium]